MSGEVDRIFHEFLGYHQHPDKRAAQIERCNRGSASSSSWMPEMGKEDASENSDDVESQRASESQEDLSGQREDELGQREDK